MSYENWKNKAQGFQTVDVRHIQQLQTHDWPYVARVSDCGCAPYTGQLF